MQKVGWLIFGLGTLVSVAVYKRRCGIWGMDCLVYSMLIFIGTLLLSSTLIWAGLLRRKGASPNVAYAFGVFTTVGVVTGLYVLLHLIYH